MFNDGHDGVTVKRGSVREFAFGVLVLGGRGNRVIDVSSKKNTLFGLVFGDSSHSVIRDSVGNNNIPPEGDGMGVFGSHDLRIVDNTFRNNPLGLHVEDSTDNLIKGNLCSREGLFLQADRNRVRRNRFVDRAGILDNPGSRNEIARHRVSRGNSIEEGRGNLVKRNDVVDARQVGIILGFQERAGGANNVVRRNLVRGSGTDGFLVNEKEKHSVLKRNVAVGSRDDGFDVESRSTKLAKNRATNNRDLGIEARRGVIDGGGNRANGNGDKRQCVHVKCH